MPTNSGNGLGPVAGTAAGKVRTDIAEGRIAAGELLPSVRQLARAQSLDTKTAWRALKGLEAEGLVAAEPGRGFRVLAGAQDPARGCPMAYVLGDMEVPLGRESYQHGRLVAFQEAAARRGWSLLAVSCAGRSRGQVIEELKSVRVSGAVTDSQDPEFIAALEASSIPTVMVDMFMEGAGLDTVMQDGHNGGLLAARYLLQRGCKRIAWFGPIYENAHALDRLGGVTAALCTAWGEMPRDLLVETRPEEVAEASVERARAMLSRADRPDAVIALWTHCALAVKQAADELGLRVGRDFQMVGWSVEEEYERSYRPAFGDGPVPPAVTWSARTMAETAFARLAERRENPGLEPLIVKVPTRLRFAE